MNGLCAARATRGGAAPRLEQSRRPGNTAREEILDAAILDALLAGTVDEALRLAGELLAQGGSAGKRLHALVVADCSQLCGSR